MVCRAGVGCHGLLLLPYHLQSRVRGGPIGAPRFAAGGFLEEEEGGEGFSGDSEISEDDHYLVGQASDFGGLALFQIGDDQVEGVAGRNCADRAGCCGFNCPCGEPARSGLWGPCAERTIQDWH